MNKKTAPQDVAQLFPNARSERRDGKFILPLHSNAPSLKLVIPEELPIGINAVAMLPGDIHVASSSKISQDLGTEFPIRIGAGRYEEDAESGPELHFEDWLAAGQLLVVSRWELTPPVQTVSGMNSLFAKSYRAHALMRLTPPEMLGLNPVLLPVPTELSPPIGPMSGLDFWIIDRPGFYEVEAKILSENLRQAILMGDREQYNDTTRSVCKNMFEAIAKDIETDDKLKGWKLKCGDTEAEITMFDRNGRKQTQTALYTPAYLAGVQRYITEGRNGTLVFPDP